MTANQLQTCREVLETAYREKLGIGFGSAIAEIKKGQQPVWRTVSSDDLITELQSMADGAAGLLLDPEIGLFKNKTANTNQTCSCIALPIIY
jgi:hypothetical protein